MNPHITPECDVPQCGRDADGTLYFANRYRMIIRTCNFCEPHYRVYSPPRPHYFETYEEAAQELITERLINVGL